MIIHYIYVEGEKNIQTESKLKMKPKPKPGLRKEDRHIASDDICENMNNLKRWTYSFRR